MKKFLLTCDPGLEDICKKEIKERIKSNAKPFFNFQGKLLAECKDAKKLFSLHSIHNIIELKKTFRVNNLKELYNIAKHTRIKEMKSIESFRVTSKRFGEHNFTSMHVQDIVGKALQEKYNKKVSLKNFDLNIRVDIIGNFGFIGIQHTRESLYRRFKKIFNHIASIKSTIAYGMICLADIKKGETLLDPMCGSGTIPMEAASIFGKKIKIIAGDISERVVKGARKNAEINKLDNIEFKRIDARKLDGLSDIDKIITNPPYGVKIGKRENLKKLYYEFLLSAEKVLSDKGRIVVINLKADMFRTIIFKTKMFKIVHERVVESGGLYPHIFVLEKLK